MHKSFLFSTFSPTLHCYLLDDSHCGRCAVFGHFIVILTCISLVSHIEHFSMCLEAICRSSLEKMSILLPIKFFLIVWFLMLSCVSSLYIWILTPYPFAIIISWFSRRSLCFVDSFLLCKKSFAIQYSPICLLLLLFPLPEERDPKRKEIAKNDVEESTDCIFY